MGIKVLKYAKPVRDIAEEGIDDMLNTMVGGMLVRAGFPCRTEVKPGEYRLVKVVTDDNSAGMLIGRQGQTIDAVEHIVSRMADMGAGDRVRMNLDINNYRLRSQDDLTVHVEAMIQQVLSTGEEVHLAPMGARERRLVHLEAEEQGGLRTRTEFGEGGKHVVISVDNGEVDEEVVAPTPVEPVETAADEAVAPTPVEPVETAADEAVAPTPVEADETTSDEDDDERPAPDSV